MLKIFEKLFCNHDWQVVVKETHKSPYLKTKESLPNSSLGSIGSIPVSLLLGKSITILKCTKCGKIDKTIVDV
jgi:hypothetical protein